MKQIFNFNIEDFIDALNLNFKEEKYLDENVKVLIDNKGNNLYLISKYNTITCSSTGVEEVYELKRSLIDGQSQLNWVKVR